MKYANARHKEAAPSSISGRTLRQRAEEIAVLSPGDVEALSPDEVRQTFHELQVHQIELEMQNEELRRAQVELDAARARYFDLYDLAPVGYCTLSEKGLMLEANLTAATLLGAARNALVKQPITHFILKEDQDIYYLHRKQLLETGEPQVCELRMVREDGTQLWARLEATAAQASGGNIDQIRIIMIDITKRRQAEQELARHRDHLEELVEQRTAELTIAIERLRELDYMKDEFIANVSHELRMPLTNIKLFLHMLGLKPEKYDTYIATLEHETDRLISIVEDLLFVSRVDREQEALNITPVDLNTLAESFVTDRTLIMENKNLALTVKQMPALPVIQADRKRLGRVLDVLLTNALYYTPSGGQITISTQTSKNESKQWAGFSVSDTGLGIPLEEQSLIFDRFFRGKVGRDSGMPGTGLGLAIAKEVVGWHQGRINVDSEGIPGKGSTFTVWLPIHEGQSSQGKPGGRGDTAENERCAS